MKRAFFFTLLLIAVPAFAEPAKTLTVERFTFAVPEGWKQVPPPSPMRKAQLEVGEDAAKAEATFFHFGGGSGSVADNVARWFSQFPGSEKTQKSESVEVNGVKITFVEAAGTFNSGMPGGPTQPMAEYALRGAILENPETGDVYVKLTGPKETVESATAAFQKMVKDAAGPVAR